MRRGRATLLVISAVLILLLAGGGLAVRVGAADATYRQVVLFSEVLSLVVDNYVDPVDAEGLIEGAYRGMLASLDAHGSFLTPSEVAEWKRKASATDQTADPGVNVIKAYGALTIVSVAPGSPAEAEGLSRGDQIRKIDGRVLRDLSLDQSRALLNGPVGTSVRLSVLHARENLDKQELTLSRAKRTERPYKIEIDGDVAVLRIQDLARLEGDRLESELDPIENRGCQRLLIDLRDVPHGSVRDARALAELFAPGDLLVLKDRQGRVLETVKSRRAHGIWKGPIGVLLNGGSAGGAEAVARLLQARRGALVFGENSYGLGAEPKLLGLPDGSGLLLSGAVWEVPSGRGWNGDGIAPDRLVRAEGKPEEARDEQLRKVLEQFSKVPPGSETLPKAA